jgi:DedD protein
MDRGLKERLVGAAVLVAIGAWLIPWVLDGPERIDATETTSLQLPTPVSDTPAIRTETVVLDRQQAPTVTTPEPTVEPNEVAAAPVPPPEPEPEPAVAVEAPAPAVAASAPVATETPSPSPATTRWYTQLGAFGDEGNADRLAARVSTYGYDATVSAAPGGGGTVHRVRVGPETTRAQAEAIASALSAHGFVAQVVFE